MMFFRHFMRILSSVAPGWLSPRFASPKKSRSRAPTSGTRSEAFLKKATNRVSGNRALHPLSNTIFQQIILLFACAALLSGCVMPPVEENYFDYSAFRSADPRSILIVPVVNNSVDVDASDYFLSAISQPVAERGYTSFPLTWSSV